MGLIKAFFNAMGGNLADQWAEVIEADIAIKTQREDLQVWGVNAEGFYVGRIPTKYEDGIMSFTVGKTLPACYYLVVAD